MLCLSVKHLNEFKVRASLIIFIIFFLRISGQLSVPRRIDATNAATSFKSSGNSQQGSSEKSRNFSRKSGAGTGGGGSSINLGDEDMRDDFKFK